MLSAVYGFLTVVKRHSQDGAAAPQGRAPKVALDESGVNASITQNLQNLQTNVILPSRGYVLTKPPTDTQTTALASYIEQLLGEPVTLAAAPIASQLPFFLTGHYMFARFSLLGQSYLALIENEPGSTTPANARKHCDLVAGKTTDLCVFVTAAVTAATRARLIAQRVPFVVPGSQLYLPELGIALRELFRQQHAKPDALSPAAQVTLLYALQQPAGLRMTLLAFAGQLHYSAMTMTRVANELLASGLADVSRNGRHRWLDFGTAKEDLWTRALPYLRSPVQQTALVGLPDGQSLPPPLARAGHTALADTTAIAAGNLATYAAGPECWRALLRKGFVSVPLEEMASAKIEIWRYDPMLLASNGRVDPLSLYLSLRDENDDRVAMALDELKAALPWW